MGEEWREDKETAKQAAIREVKEETGLDISQMSDSLKKIGVYEGNRRDTRDNEESWSRSTAFYLKLPYDYDVKNIQGLDDAQDAKFFSLNDIINMDLAFDHKDMIKIGLKLYND